jgi:hypothetical protein
MLHCPDGPEPWPDRRARGHRRARKLRGRGPAPAHHPERRQPAHPSARGRGGPDTDQPGSAVPADAARPVAGAAGAADAAAVRRGEPGARPGQRRRAAGGGQRRLPAHLVRRRAGGRGRMGWHRDQAARRRSGTFTGTAARRRRARRGHQRSGGRARLHRPAARSAALCSRRRGGVRRPMAAGRRPAVGGHAGHHLRREGRASAQPAGAPWRRAAARRPPGPDQRRLLRGRPRRARLGHAARAAGPRGPGRRSARPVVTRPDRRSAVLAAVAAGLAAADRAEQGGPRGREQAPAHGVTPLTPTWRRSRHGAASGSPPR